jgi:hypothetical protein
MEIIMKIKMILISLFMALFMLPVNAGDEKISKTLKLRDVITTIFDRLTTRKLVGMVICSSILKVYMGFQGSIRYKKYLKTKDWNSTDKQTTSDERVSDAQHSYKKWRNGEKTADWCNMAILCMLGGKIVFRTAQIINK